MIKNLVTLSYHVQTLHSMYSIIATVHMSTLDKKKDTHGCIRRSNHEIMLCLDAYKKRQIMLCKATLFRSREEP